jgi:hypothetical protein
VFMDNYRLQYGHNSYVPVAINESVKFFLVCSLMRWMRRNVYSKLTEVFLLILEGKFLKRETIPKNLNT